ncbi:protein toll-like isoform X1 [Armigeres subalbatus]|uniref:protein toll-like isoform X1 n=1 Tax=Armigeres subalbatus TaxID=124917 RepID=UPI002ED18925
MKCFIVLYIIMNIFNVFADQHLDYIIGEELLGPIASESAKFSCPEPNPTDDCSCMHAITDYEIQCPIVNPEIIVKIKPEAYAQVQCYDRHDLGALPTLKAGNTTQVKVIHCPLPEDKSILQLVSFLGVQNVKDFWYQSYGKDSGVQLLRPHFAGMQNLEKLFLSAGIDHIRPDLFADLHSLKWMVLRGNNLTRLGNVFQNLTDLVILELGANQITELEAGFLQKQSKLRHLNLWHNEIRTVDKQTFYGVESLEELDLSVNLIDSLDKDVFSGFEKLSTLNLGFNNFSSFQAGLLSSNRYLKEFKMINNLKPITILPSDFLRNLPMLTSVILSRNGFSEIPESIFFGSSALLHIDLSYNNFRYLPEVLLRDQHLLKNLNVAYNKLELLPDKLLENASELAILDLSFNRLHNISAKCFSSLDKLTELHLENNNLLVIDLIAFSEVVNLQNLFLQNNFLQYSGSNTKSPFQYLNNLRTLNLMNNSIDVMLHDWNFNTIHLRELDLSFNQFTRLTYLNLHFISRDIRIDLTNNRIAVVDMNDFQAPSSLQHTSKTGKILVNLEGNEFDCNCHMLSFVQYIQNHESPTNQRIRFVTNNLHCFEPENLQLVDISDVSTEDLTCPLNKTNCPTECHCFQRPIDLTVIVNCTGRELVRIPDLPHPNKLEYKFVELHIENNKITELPSGGLSAVSKLYARNNSISNLQNTSILDSLRILDLSLNHLTTLDVKTIQNLNKSRTLERLHLGSNPWQCDCSSVHFLEFVQQTFHLIVDTNHITCPNGERLANISISNLCKDHWTMIIAVCLSVLLLGLSVGICASICFAYHNEIKIWLFKRNLLLCWVTEQELDKDKRFDAFISYSHHDEDFVANHLVPTLEQPPMNFRTCWHMRDWTPGELIAEQIDRSISESRRTIVVLSKSFLESVWARMEFRTAHLNSIAERRTRVIVIMYEHFGDIELLDADLKAYLRMNTYIRWGDPWFWDRLQYAMPHPPYVRGLKKVRCARSYEIGLLEDRQDVSKSQIVAYDEHRGYINPMLSHSLGSSMEELDGTNNFEGINIIDSRYLDELFIIITKESEV